MSSVQSNSFVVCSIHATHVQRGRNGLLTLLKMEDTAYVVRYTDAVEEISTDIDLVFFEQQSSDELLGGFSLSNSKVWIQQLSPSFGQSEYIVKDHEEFDCFVKAVEEVRRYCELKLRLNSVFRDVYYAGLYSCIDVNSEDTIIYDELVSLRREQPENFFLSSVSPPMAASSLPPTIPPASASATDVAVTAIPSAGDEVIIDENRRNNSSRKRSSTRSKHNNIVSSRILFEPSEVNCVYCAAERVKNPSTLFYVHPYVSYDANGHHVFMCDVCIDAWKTYRQKLEASNELVLEGEVNEELCAVCSNPECGDVVMCSSCPRSFCDECMEKLAEHSVIADLKAQEDVDWYCFCCVNNASLKPALVRQNWQLVQYVNVSAVQYSSAGASKVKDETSTYKSSSSSSSGKSGNQKIATKKKVERAIEKENEKRELEKQRGAVEKRGSGRISEEQGGVKRGRETFNAISETTILNKNAKSTSRFESVKVNGRRKGNEKTGKSVEDEVYFFAKYYLTRRTFENDAQHYFDLVSNSEETTNESILENTKEMLNTTDDSCFLCKDGGDLMECDCCWYDVKGIQTSMKVAVKDRVGLVLTRQCRRVYHSYCLDFEVDDDDSVWRCPRHYCSTCGDTKLATMCKYCPHSVCGNCVNIAPRKFVNANKYIDVVKTPFCDETMHKSIKLIVCGQCIDLFARAIERGTLFDEDVSYEVRAMLHNQKQFLSDEEMKKGNSDIVPVDMYKPMDATVPTATDAEFTRAGVSSADRAATAVATAMFNPSEAAVKRSVRERERQRANRRLITEKGRKRTATTTTTATTATNATVGTAEMNDNDYGDDNSGGDDDDDANNDHNAAAAEEETETVASTTLKLSCRTERMETHQTSPVEDTARPFLSPFTTQTIVPDNIIVDVIDAGHTSYHQVSEEADTSSASPALVKTPNVVGLSIPEDSGDEDDDKDKDKDKVDGDDVVELTAVVAGAEEEEQEEEDTPITAAVAASDSLILRIRKRSASITNNDGEDICADTAAYNSSNSYSNEDNLAAAATLTALKSLTDNEGIVDKLYV